MNNVAKKIKKKQKKEVHLRLNVTLEPKSPQEMAFLVLATADVTVLHLKNAIVEQFIQLVKTEQGAGLNHSSQFIKTL